MTNRFRGVRVGSPAAQRLKVSASANSEGIDGLLEVGLDAFPNDLTRMLYLASLRDCNSGRYLHPQLSPSIGVERAHLALRACHDQVFQRLVATRLSEYVVQLEEYIRYSRAERSTFLRAWQSLRAYRATVPVEAMPLYCELFSLNVELALTILNIPRPSLEPASQSAVCR